MSADVAVDRFAVLAQTVKKPRILSESGSNQTSGEQMPPSLGL